MRITKYGHACLLLEEGGARILIDPGAYSNGFEAVKDVGAILITHQHQDHLSPENIKKLLADNPQAVVYADEGSVKVLEDEQMSVQAVRDGDAFDVAGVPVRVIGREHAVIHPDIPIIPNVGYMVADKFFYPGDHLTEPRRPVEVLALPAGAPWLKVSEAADYLRATLPAVAIPVHDAVLAIPEMNYGLYRRLAPEGTKLVVVPNGQSVDF